MKKTPVIIIFDVGKTNKKIFAFDEDYRIVYKDSAPLPEIKDEDGFPCEDIFSLTAWVKNKFESLMHDSRFNIKAVNFSAYGASFVLLNEQKKVIAPLYNYLKPYPENLKKQFYNVYGLADFPCVTASPVLGSLNSGMQLYRLKYEKPELFNKIKYALHLPQYLSFVLSGSLHSEITSIGCHTNLWNFQTNQYHDWVTREGVLEKLPPIKTSEEVAASINSSIMVGVGLHDSSAALLPYLKSKRESFVLLSTGTWCISLNPFNHAELSKEELTNDCLSYLTIEKTPIKASRLFSGAEHDEFVKKASKHFRKPLNHYENIVYDTSLNPSDLNDSYSDLNRFNSYKEAYHRFMYKLIQKQKRSTDFVLKPTDVKNIFVDGGFSQNTLFMNGLSKVYREMKVYSATIAQASSIGAALVIHSYWNTKSAPSNLIDLKLFS